MNSSFPRIEAGRLVLAALVAPALGIIALALFAVLALGIGADRNWVDRAANIRFSLFFLLLFGMPIALILEVVIGVPAYSWLERTNRLRLGWVVVFGALGGAIAFAAAWPGLNNNWSPTNVMLSALCGALGGSVAGAAFWVLAFASVSARRAA